QRAQDVAEVIVTQTLKSGDSASLVLLSDRPEAVIATPSYDLQRVRQRIRAAMPGDRATDYLAGAEVARRLLAASQTPVKEVYWLTDDQASGWNSSRKEAARAVWQGLSALARIVWVSVGPPGTGRDNLAVEPPVISRELVTPRLPVRIEARIRNHGTRPHNDLLVHLKVDGNVQASRRVSVGPAGEATVQVPVRLVRPGVHSGSIELDNAGRVDNLPQDNRAPFVLRVREQIRALVWDPYPAASPTRSETFYLLTAMAPGGATESLAPRLREGGNLTGVNLSDFDLVVIAGVNRISPSEQRALRDYVQAGGGLMLFPGPGTDARRFNTDWKPSGLLPATLGEKQIFEEEEALTLNPATIAHPALALFKDTATMNLGSARVKVAYTLRPEVDTGDPNAIQTMIRFSNGEPAFVERKVGLGRVILAATGAGSSWSELPLRASYVPLVYQLLSHLGQGSASRRNLKQDEPFFLTFPLSEANKPVLVRTPSGKVETRSSALDVRGVTFTYTGTTQAGVYRVSVAGGRSQDAFAVNLTPEESDLTSADPEKTAQQSGVAASRFTVVDNPAQIQASVQRSRYGAEVWRGLVWVLIALLFIEAWLARWFGRRG
ncbi:MAG: hypothetical protein RMJ43_16100, partial [Chloroherpetonaceae bacterium]|nr:hypothetical protein [Chthonomonadaceae bacterium]MDW8209356.1 hypothetical protein [Chloroherpetonaceae bacterium]